MSLHDLEMREVYCNTLIKHAKKDKRIVVLEADLMMSTGTREFGRVYPNRLIDCGIAEANMMGIAAGLASTGKVPFVHSFTPFVTRRCYDQIAISVSYAKQNVKIVGTDPGIMATANGGTHMSFEDISLMMNIPNMIIFEPIDAVMLERAMPTIIKSDSPMYIRLFRKKAPPVFNGNFNFDLFRANEVVFGKDITIVACGIMVHRAIKAANILKQNGIDATVIAVHTYKPLDSATILNSINTTGAVLVAENSHLIGGLGQTLATILMEKGYHVPFGTIGVADRYGEVGTEAYLAELLGLTENHIVKKACELVSNKSLYTLTHKEDYPTKIN